MSSELKVVTNGHYRELEYKVPEWSDEEELCFNYKGNIYFLSEFLITTSNCFRGWDGYLSETFFSGILVNLSECGEGVKVGYYYS